MVRNLIAAAVAVVVFAGGLVAGEVKGKLVKIDGDKITVMVGAKKDVKGEEKTFTVLKDAKVVSVSGKKGEQKEETLSDGLKNAAFAKVGSGKGGPVVTLITDDKDGVKELKVSAAKKKEKKKKAA